MTPSEKPNDANAATAVVVVVSIVAGVGCFMYVAWALGGWTGCGGVGRRALPHAGLHRSTRL